MANITILDSGYVSVSEEGSQETLISNSGSSITLKSVDLNYQRGQNVDDSPITGGDSNATLNPVSVSNPIITLTGSLNRTSSDDMNQIILLDGLVRSKGVKLLYYASTDADMSGGDETDGWTSVISKLGEENLDGDTNQKGDTIVDVHTQSGGSLYNSADPFPHLHVFVTGLRITQSSSSGLLRFNITCEIQ